MQDEFEMCMESDALSLSSDLARRFEEVISNIAMQEAARERRPANCDDVTVALQVIVHCDIRRLMTADFPPAE